MDHTSGLLNVLSHKKNIPTLQMYPLKRQTIHLPHLLRTIQFPFNPTRQYTSRDKTYGRGIDTTREENISAWYSQVTQRAELISYTDINGCYVIRPYGYGIWEKIQSYFDQLIKKSGVKNAYFPCFVSKKALEAEAENFSGFQPEVAWVTKSGGKDLQEPIAVRPTSEAIMYPIFSKWINSHRDLPLRLNQWCSVVRWEMARCVPFLRSREFLWQEGHSVFATQEEADKEAFEILNLYAKVFEELLAVPVTKGKKTEKEKFAGAAYTTTLEAFVQPNGRGIQAATSHCLGNGFAKAYDIQFQNENGEKIYPVQNSWGLSIRSIGALIMVHGDNKGLRLPPRVAPIQVIVIPLGKNPDKTKPKIQEIVSILRGVSIRVEVDDRADKNPGWKYNHWELKGVPLRIECGEYELKENIITCVRRDTGEKSPIAFNSIGNDVPLLLEKIQNSLFEQAKKLKDEHTKIASTWEDFIFHLKSKNIVLVPFCGDPTCESNAHQRSAEEQIENEDSEFALTGAKSLCQPFEQPPLKKETKCFFPDCKNHASSWTLFGRSY